MDETKQEQQLEEIRRGLPESLDAAVLYDGKYAIVSKVNGRILARIFDSTALYSGVLVYPGSPVPTRPKPQRATDVWSVTVPVTAQVRATDPGADDTPLVAFARIAVQVMSQGRGSETRVGDFIRLSGAVEAAIRAIRGMDPGGR